MPEPIVSIHINKLVAHPDNPNVMSNVQFKKLVRNIQRSGLYEPIIVRPHPQKQDQYQIINGHHRVKALEKLGLKEANCIIWNVDDKQTAILLATLNRLSGIDDPAKKIVLLRKLKKQLDTGDLAKLLPDTAKQIEQLTNLKLDEAGGKLPAAQFAVPLVFFVTAQQREIIETTLSSIENQASSVELTKAHRRAEALTKIAEFFARNGGLNNAQKQ